MSSWEPIASVGLFTFIVLFWGQECVWDAWEARRGGGAEERKVKNVQFETGLEGRRRRNLQMFSLSFFKLRSTYMQGMHRPSVYGLVNCYLHMHLCNRQFLEARVHAVMCIWPKDGIYQP